MHPDLDLVKLYLKPLLIGELSPEEPSQERHKSVSEVSGLRNMWRDVDKSQLIISSHTQELIIFCEKLAIMPGGACNSKNE